MHIFFSKLHSVIQHPRFRVAVGIVLSLIIHIVVILHFLRDQVPPPLSSSSAVRSELEVSFITPPKPVVQQQTQPVLPKPVSQPQTTQIPQQVHKKSAAKPQAAPKTTSSLKLPSQIKVPAQTQEAQESPAMDMSQMVSQARERRQQLAQEQQAQNAPKAPSSNDIAKANIDFQMDRSKDGKNGIFQILNKGPRVATYAFFGWDKNKRDARKQIITVEAGADGDVELALIDSMIKMIRQYYKGNFNWESDRLGRVIVLSAKVEDTKELQTFLRQEMFSVR